MSFLFNNRIKSLSIFMALACIQPSVVSAKISLKNPLKKTWQCSTSKENQWLCKETGSQNKQIFNTKLSKDYKRILIANALQWLPNNDPENICKGTYVQTKQKPPTKKAITSQDEISGNINGVITIKGNIEIHKGDQTFSAGEAQIKLDPKKHSTVKNIKLKDYMNLNQPNILLIGKNGEADLENHTAVINNSYYRLKVKYNNIDQNSEDNNSNKNNHKRFTGYAHGHADKIIQNDKNIFTLKNATYATGNPRYENDWYLSSSKLRINNNKHIAKLWNAVLYVKGYPLVYLPYFSFPTDDARSTGFLSPKIGSDNAGYYIATPFYLNLATNYDFLFTPTYYFDAGLMLNTRFRYLTSTDSGNINAHYMFHDKRTGSKHYFIDFEDSGNYSNNISTHYQYQAASDNDVFNDFSHGSSIATNQLLLNRQAKISYANKNWDIGLNIQSMIASNKKLNLQNRPYATLPQINANANYPGFYKLINFKLQSQFTYFYKQDLNNKSQVNGQRIYTLSSFDLPLKKSWGFLTPSIALSQSYYILQNKTNNIISFKDGSVERALPIFKINAGLYLDRKFKFNGKSYKQTIEPKIFYSYIPYINQDNIPLFDTSPINFTYQSLFAVNQFSGLDRLNNANQITYAVQSNTIDKNTGKSRLNIGIGQKLYFTPNKVSSCQGYKCSNSSNISGSNLSPVAGFLSYNISPELYFNTNITYQQNNNTIDSQSYAIQYKKDSQHILNVSYSTIKNDVDILTPEQIQNNTSLPLVSQMSLSGIWRISPKWEIAGMYNYDFIAKKTTNMFVGLNYEEDSWASSILVQRGVAFNENPNDPSKISGPLQNSIMFQLTLKGLGSTPDNGMQENLNTISGYNEQTSGFN